MSKQKIREWLKNHNYKMHEHSYLPSEDLLNIIHQYTQEQSGWVSVDSGKPKQGERVLLKTTYDDHCPYVVGYWGCGEWEACTVNVMAEKDYNGNEALVDRAFESANVTHWQPLPPTEEGLV